LVRPKILYAFVQRAYGRVVNRARLQRVGIKIRLVERNTQRPSSAENQGGRVEISKLSFKICHTKGEGSEKACDFIVCEGDEFPKVVDSYEEYLAKPSEELKQEILYFANRFIGKEGYYTEVSAEYVIPKQ
jgi:hypothetical protein